MRTNTAYRKPNFIVITLLIGLLAAFLIGLLYTNPAYASGLVSVSSNEFVDIKFIAASTNDQESSTDPGQSVHIGQCTAVLEDKRVEFRIFNGYPGYECTLSVRLKNLSEETVRLQQVATRIPEELVITQPDLIGNLVLQPQEEASLEFVLDLHQNVKENEEYRFSIDLIFEDFNQHTGQ